MYLRPALAANTNGPAEVRAVLCSVALSHAGGENGASSTITERALLNLCLVPAYSLVKACMLDSKGIGWHQAPGWFHLKCIINWYKEKIWRLNCLCVVVDFCNWTGFFKAIYHIDKYCPKRILVPCTLFRLIPYAVIRLFIVECILRCVILLCCSSLFC